ncbi:MULTISPECIES: methylenetetrahydrofolate reductase [NAD(P)H] [Rhodococcus]|uniref:Methylenetetrahydrofolate reductase n=1 Tax=Rhodococcus jostii TaxID=132919 RepID=A0ABU4C8R3_RHOJO|nr:MULTISPECIES: methylenetetrahydrofolate reductase [NAD(P)H] [Rhodococcus]MDI9950121.1 methylenetetrahydrofolate reductase [NAD(P)H] [Rhodococcus sp. IEGM 1305]MDV6279931.1 methylenetetrahydrofolate reductase [NAD(P)H] [Rhodococcus jostii]
MTRTPSIVDRIRSSSDGRVPFSVEFSPPRDEAAEARLWRAVREFERMGPAFVSMTYGAGGSTRDRTVRVTGQLAEETTLLPVAHLTAVSHSVDELRSMVGAYADRGISNILVLRGDPPGDPLGEWEKHPDGVEYAEDLVRLVRDLGDFHVGVASFPEGHYRAPDLAHDTRYLVSKLRAGAEYSITQMFFDVDDYLRLRDRVSAYDPEQGAKPIIPEIMPITSLRSVRRVLELSGSRLPAHLENRLAAAAGDGPEENRAAVREIGIDVATEMSERLIAEGAPGLHFITLNFARATSEVLARLGDKVGSGVAVPAAVTPARVS